MAFLEGPGIDTPITSPLGDRTRIFDQIINIRSNEWNNICTACDGGSTGGLRKGISTNYYDSYRYKAHKENQRRLAMERAANDAKNNGGLAFDYYVNTYGQEIFDYTLTVQTEEHYAETYWVEGDSKVYAALPYYTVDYTIDLGNNGGSVGNDQNGGIADAAEQYLAQNTMPGNWRLGDNTDPAVTGGYSFGAKNPPGMCVDCSGLISGSFIAAGFADPNHGGKGSGILNIESNLTKVNYPQRGDVFTIRNPKGYKYHGGIVTGVQSVVTGYTMDVPIYGTEVTVIHSSSRRGGPVRDTFVVGGSSYYARNLFGFFRN